MNAIEKYNNYQILVDNIGGVMTTARSKALQTINFLLVESNWQIGKYIVEFEQNGNQRALYGQELLNNLSKDLTSKYGKGFSRSNLVYARKLYIAFPKCETQSHK